VVLGQQGHRLGETERGTLPGGEEGRLPPGGQRVDPLLGLASGAGVLGVHVDAVRAPVELRSTDPDQLAQPVVEVHLVELLGRGVVEVRQCLGERRGMGVEVQPDGHLHGGGGHDELPRSCCPVF